MIMLIRTLRKVRVPAVRKKVRFFFFKVREESKNLIFVQENWEFIEKSGNFVLDHAANCISRIIAVKLDVEGCCWKVLSPHL